MTLSAANTLVNAATLYVVAGGCFAVPFLWRWVGQLDPATRHATWGFRVLVLPGVALLWPLFAWRLGAAGTPAISDPRPVAPAQGGSRAADSEPHLAVAAGDFAAAAVADFVAAAVEAFEVAEAGVVDAGRTSTSSTKWSSSAGSTTGSVTIVSPTAAATRPMSG